MYLADIIIAKNCLVTSIGSIVSCAVIQRTAGRESLKKKT
jgi:hypothetical protein